MNIFLEQTGAKLQFVSVCSRIALKNSLFFNCFDAWNRILLQFCSSLFQEADESSNIFLEQIWNKILFQTSKQLKKHRFLHIFLEQIGIWSEIMVVQPKLGAGKGGGQQKIRVGKRGPQKKCEW